MQQFIGKIVSNSEDKNKSRNVLQIWTAVSCLAIVEQRMANQYRRRKTMTKVRAPIPHPEAAPTGSKAR